MAELGANQVQGKVSTYKSAETVNLTIYSSHLLEILSEKKEGGLHKRIREQQFSRFFSHQKAAVAFRRDT